MVRDQLRRAGDATDHRYPCPPCSRPNVDQATGTVDPPAVSPMRTLRDYRVRGGAVNFGVYLRPTGDLGTLKVGDGLAGAAVLAR